MKIQVNGVQTKIINKEVEIITTNTINYFQCMFEFNSIWKGLDKTAIFYVDKNNSLPMLLQSTNPSDINNNTYKCNIPNELLINRKTLYIGVLGTEEKDSTIVQIATTISNIELTEGIIGANSTIAPPTPNIYAQILEELNKKGEDLLYSNKVLQLLSNGIVLSEIEITGFLETEIDPTVSEHIKQITEEDISSWNGKQPSGNYVLDNDARLSDSRNAIDVYTWAKQTEKPSYTAEEVGALPNNTPVLTEDYVNGQIDAVEEILNPLVEQVGLIQAYIDELQTGIVLVLEKPIV